MSPLRKPASTWATGMSSFLASMEQASVEFTSPTTSTQSGRAFWQISSKATMILAVCGGVAAAAGLQVVIGLGNPQLVEEDVAHLPVVVLAGVDDA